MQNIQLILLLFLDLVPFLERLHISQDLSFLSPVEIGSRLTAVCEIVGTFGQNKYELTTDVFDEDGQKVVEGEAAVLIDDLPVE